MIMLRPNLALNTDSYKLSHPWQYPDGLEYMQSYFESRGGLFGKTMSLGYQGLAKTNLLDPVTKDDVEEAKEVAEAHGEPFEYGGWMRIVDKFEGKPPIRILAVPEGTMVPTHNLLMRVESMDKETAWLPGHVESMLVRLWYPQTVATLSHYIKRDILEALIKSSNDPWGEILFKLHDFGARGCSSLETAGIGGMAHLVNFQGTDTIEALRYVRKYYGESMAGFSIPAAEHSTITSWGRENELLAYRNMVKQFAKPGKFVACVSDSYDIYNAVRLWGSELREEVKASGGTLVIRPDSGIPVEVVMKCLRILEDQVGMTKNMKGYKVLPSYFRLIQGDGVNRDSIREILAEMLANGYSASNIAFGMGGGLLQQVNRDTQKYAYKCSQVIINGQPRRVFKDPVTDQGKKSKAGNLDIVFENGQFKTIELEPGTSLSRNTALKPIYEMGKLLVDEKFSDVRKRADSDLVEGYGRA